MLRNRLYYAFKPLFPWRARRAMRSWFAVRKRARIGEVWPILNGSEKPPTEWPGWPDGKQFAVVLTHDVEGPHGLAKCRRLMEIEKNFGFRSTFNLIPEGTYTVPKDLRDELTENGFEVGVHDLHHDGKLYTSRREFSKKAQQINHYLREWGAVGFRSGFMLHNLDWAHDLDVLYEASTFDTDPFEPQPDGMGTIFPVWIPRPHSKSDPAPGKKSDGYVELPYTLVQDSTLFLLLKEPDPGVWFQKIDWIAKHGGMALLDSHPDYMGMDQPAAKSSEYPVAQYERLLEFIRSKYRGAYWHGTAAELAGWYKETVHARQAGSKVTEPRPIEVWSASALSTAPKRICMISHSMYDCDNRVRRYAEELARRGDTVEAFALKLDPEQATINCKRGVTVHLLGSRSRHGHKTSSAFLWPVLKFWFLAALRVSWSHFKKPYDLVHVHNVPDFLVFTAVIPKLCGAKIILDIHDILPEFYVSKFGASWGSAGARLMRLIERFSARFADHVIISNHLWRSKYAPRTRTTARCSVFVNSVDDTIFRDHPRTRFDEKLIVVFPGGLHWHQGLDIAIRAFSKVFSELRNAEFHIYGFGPVKQELMALAASLGLEEKVRFLAPVALDSVPQIMANADLGIVPKRADSFGNEAYSTKIMEFMALGVPVVVSDTAIDRYYFDDSVVRFFESGNSDSLADAMLEVLRDKGLGQRLVRNGFDYATRNNWQARKAEYLDLVDALIAGREISRTDPPQFQHKSSGLSSVMSTRSASSPSEQADGEVLVK